jgi:hypothetical protein
LLPEHLSKLPAQLTGEREKVLAFLRGPAAELGLQDASQLLREELA